MRMSLHRDTGLQEGDRKVSNIRQRHAAQCGFSLIELIIVVAIMSVLIGLTAPLYMKYVAKQRRESCERNREAILRIYERALYDNSIDDIHLNETDLQKVVNGTYPATSAEVSRYRECRNHATGGAVSCDYQAKFNSSTGTVYIECKDCMDKCGDDYTVVSLDLLGWNGEAKAKSADDPREEPASSSEEPPPDPEKWTVSFDAQGIGNNPASVEVEDGDKVDNPGRPKGLGILDTVYEFGGWYEDPGCTGTAYNFNTPVTSTFTLYAKWTEKNGDSIWPYPDQDGWWTQAGIQQQIAAGRATNDYKFSDDQYVCILGPTGIFKSKDTGALFCIIRQNSSGGTKIYKSMASSPEYYSSIQGTLNQSLVHLTGTRDTYDISGYRNNDRISVSAYTYGDLIEFINNGTSYLYVYWHVNDGEAETATVTKSQIMGYPYKLGNLYRVNP